MYVRDGFWLRLQFTLERTEIERLCGDGEALCPCEDCLRKNEI